MTVVNPFDFFVEGYATTFPFHTPPISRPNSRPISSRRSRGRCSCCMLKEIPREADSTSFSGRTQRATAEKSATSSDGAGHSDAGGDAGCRLRLVPRLGLAVDPHLPPPRPRGAFRLRLSHSLRPDIDPVEGPREVETISPICMLGPSLSSGAGWIGFDVTSGMLTGEGHPRSPPRRITVRRADLGQRRLRHVDFGFDMSVRRIREAPRITRPFSDESWARRPSAKSTPISRRDDVRPTMGGEPTFVSIDDLELARMEHRRRRPDQEALADELIRSCMPDLRRAGFCITGRANGIRAKACRAGLRPLLAQGRRPIWKNAGLIANIESPRKAIIEDAQGFMEGIARRLGLDAGLCHGGL